MLPLLPDDGLPPDEPGEDAGLAPPGEPGRLPGIPTGGALAPPEVCVLELLQDAADSTTAAAMTPMLKPRGNIGPIISLRLKTGPPTGRLRKFRGN